MHPNPSEARPGIFCFQGSKAALRILCICVLLSGVPRALVSIVCHPSNLCQYFMSPPIADVGLWLGASGTWLRPTRLIGWVLRVSLAQATSISMVLLILQNYPQHVDSVSLVSIHRIGLTLQVSVD